MTDPALRIASEPAATPPLDLDAGFEAFFEREKGALFRALCLVTRNRFEAEELTQDAFLRVFERWDRVAAIDDPTGYLYRTAMNAFRSLHRRAAVAARRTIHPAPPDDLIDELESTDAVVRALAPLSERRRAAVVLMDLLGYSSEEAGRMLGIRPATVRMHASRAHAELKRVMGEDR